MSKVVSKQLHDEEFQRSLINWREFSELYVKEVLADLDPNEIYNELKGHVALCHCKSEECHRHLVRGWLILNGKDVREM